MVKCEDCALLEVIGTSVEEFQNRCPILNEINIEIWEERECIDFQPGP